MTQASYSSASLMAGGLALVALAVAAFAIVKLSTKPEKRSFYGPGTLGHLYNPSDL